MSNWSTKKLGEVLEKNGVIPAKIKRDEYQTNGKYPVVDQGENLIAGYIDDEQKLYQGDLPVIIFGDHTRILKYVDFPFAFGADGIKILRPQAILSPKFFYYAILLKPVQNLGYKRHFSLLKNYKIPLPPLETQKQIVERLDKIAEAQKLNGDLIQKSDELFQSLLHKELKSGKNWKAQKLENLLELCDAGVWGKATKGGGMMVLRSTNFKNGGVLDFSNVPELKIDEKKRAKVKLMDDDILLEKSGGGPDQPVGRVVYFIAPDQRDYTFANFIQRLRSDPKVVNNNFLFYHLLRLHNIGFTKKLQSQTTGIRNLKLSLYLKTEIPLPPLAIQKQIVAKLSAAQNYKTQLLAQKSKLKELFDSALATSMKI